MDIIFKPKNDKSRPKIIFIIGINHKYINYIFVEIIDD